MIYIYIREYVLMVQKADIVNPT